MITPTQAWDLARALDDVEDKYLDANKLDRFAQVAHAREWLDTMATYVTSDERCIRLPSFVGATLYDAYIDVP